MKLCTPCKSDPAVASFAKQFPLLRPRTSVKIVGGKVRKYRLLTKSHVDVNRTKCLKRNGNDEFDSRGNKTIASATRRVCKRCTIVPPRARHIARDRFFFSREESTLIRATDIISLCHIAIILVRQLLNASMVTELWFSLSDKRFVYNR